MTARVLRGDVRQQPSDYDRSHDPHKLFSYHFILLLRSLSSGSSLCNLCVLCASVVKNCSRKQPQRHREHRGCTEKKDENDFSCKAVLTLDAFGLECFAFRCRYVVGTSTAKHQQRNQCGKHREPQKRTNP